MNYTAVIIIFVYLLANIVVTTVSVGKNKGESVEHHIAAKNTNGSLMICLSMMGMQIAGGGILGTINDAYDRGISAAWYYILSGVALLLFSVCFIRLFRVMSAKYGCNTSSGALEALFGKRNSALNSVVFILFFLFVFSVQPKATASILCPLTGWDETAVTWISGLAYTAIALCGGLSGVLWVSAANAIILVISLVVVCSSSMELVGGFSVLYAAIPEAFYPFRPSLSKVIADGLTVVLGNCFLSNAASLSLTAKNEKAARNGFAILTVCMTGFAVMISVIGISASYLFPDVGQKGALMFLTDAIGPGMSGIAGCTIMAAIVSSAPGAIMTPSNHITEDIYHGYINRNASDKQLLAASRISCLALGILGTALSFSSDSILTLGYAGMKITSSTGIMMLIAMAWKRVDSIAAFWSVLCGAVTAFVWYLLGSPFGLDAFWASTAVTVVVLVALTLRTTNKISEGFAKYERDLVDFSD